VGRTRRRPYMASDAPSVSDIAQNELIRLIAAAATAAVEPRRRTNLDVLCDEARRIDAVLSEAKYIKADRVAKLAVQRRALACLIADYESDLFPDEAI
jgi:hypothetical protein